MAVPDQTENRTAAELKEESQTGHPDQPAENPLPIRSLIEGLLLIAGEEGLSLIQIQSVIQEESREDLKLLLDDLMNDYAGDDHGFELICYGGRYKFVSKSQVYERAKTLYQEIIIPTLSSAALETLAIIAYRQPITRVEIEEIRGVSSEAMLKKLQARNLIEARDRLDAVGKPLLYTVTEEFFDTFGLESLQELPAVETRKDHTGALFAQEEGKEEENGSSLSD